jgi:hypothetical protein
MADLPLITALGSLLAVPCIIGVTQGGDKTTQGFAGAGAVVGAWLALYRHIDFLEKITSGTLYQVIAILALVLAVIIAIRMKHQVLGTLMVTAGSLIALLALGIVGR